MSTLAQAYKNQKKWFNNRASAIFPLYINDKNDQVIVFQDYWKWKNNIDNVALVIRLRDENGDTVGVKNFKILPHNEISIKKEFQIQACSGMIECEILSLDNLGFPFPALQCFFTNENAQISSVHSAGRVYNANEATTLSKYEETNFLCTLTDDFEPFLHIFAGPYVPSSAAEIEFEIRDYENSPLFTVKLKNSLTKPFASKIFKLSDIVSSGQLQSLHGRRFFIVARFELVGAFGRLVVGNYDKKHDSLFVTHSFKYLDPAELDRTAKLPDADASIYLAAPCVEPLRLNAVSYPTNAEVEATVYERVIKGGDGKSGAAGTHVIKTGGIGGSVFRKQFNGDAFSIFFFKDDAPSRMNIEFNYSLPNSRHATDTAFQFRSHIAPPKFSHWGHGVCRPGFETYVILCNYSDFFDKTEDAVCEVQMFVLDKEVTKTITVPAESMVCIKFSEMGLDTAGGEFFSWFLRTKTGTLDTHWVSFNTVIGAICADHGY